MQEEHALAEAPQRRRAEFARAGLALAHAVGEARSHVMHEQVGEQVNRLTLQRLDR